MQIDCDGAFVKVSAHSSGKSFTKRYIGDVQRGLLVGSTFFAVDIYSENRLIVTDLELMKNEFLELNYPLNKSYRVWSIEYVDALRIIFNAYNKSDENTYRKRTTFRTFEMCRKSSIIRELPIPRYDYNISIHDGLIYYTNIYGQLSVYDGIHESQSLGIKGHTPSISPDGSQIAYIEYGIFGDSVKIFNLQTRQISSLRQLFDSWGVMPILRWSQDSRFLAIKGQSDIFATSLKIIDVLRGNIIKEYEKSNACNWFFTDW